MEKTFNVQLSPNFQLDEFLNLANFPDNIPGMQTVVNLAYGAINILQPLRDACGPIIITSGYRNKEYNRTVGGAAFSQHLYGEAADLKPADSKMFTQAVAFLAANPYVDQLLTASSWLHVSWSPFVKPRRQVIYNYYK